MKDMKDTLRYKNMVANLKNRPPYVKEAALIKEIAGGKQWRMDAAMEAMFAKSADWSGVNFLRVLEQAAMFGRLSTMEKICKTIELEHDRLRGHGVMEAFYMAVLQGHFRVADYLVEKCGAHPKYEGRDGTNSLLTVVFAGDYKKTGYLLSRGADASHALSHAVYANNKGMVEYLIKKGADVNSEVRGYSPLRTALQMGHSDMGAFLLKKGATPEKLDAGAQADILYYALSAPMPLLEKLLDRGMKPNDRLLLEVISKGDMAVAELLVTKGGLSVHGADGKEYAFLTALNSQKPDEAFQFCLRHGADAEKALETFNYDTDLYKYGARATVEKRLKNHVNMLGLLKLARKPPTP